jgi:hypothetical protein
MKTRHLIVCASATWLGLAAVACTANIHDNTITANIPNAMVNFTTDADVNNVMPDQTIPIVVAVQNVYLIDPSMTPPPEHVMDAGHLQIYLDDVAMPPLLVTAQVNVSVTVPTHTPAGPHKLICRVHKHDGTPTDTKFEINITVHVTVGTSDAGTVVPDAGSVDATGTTTDALGTD